MLNFKKIELNDKDIINKYLNLYQFESCDYFFNTLYLWNHYYNYSYCIYEDILFIRCHYSNFEMYLYPIGININRGIQILIEYTRACNIKLIFTVLEKWMIDNINEDMKNSFIVKEVRDNKNYIYDIKRLSSLAGGKLKAKRNQVNSFKSKYNYSHREISLKDKEEILSFLNTWEIGNNEDSASFDAEYKAISKALDNLKYLNIIGIALYVSDNLIAFSLASIKGDMADIHFEKANASYSGAYQMINYLMSEFLIGKVTLINREEDMGIKGLRNAKESYQPIDIGKNYNAFYKKDFNFEFKEEMPHDDVYRLWENIFNDGDYSRFFYKNTDAKLYTARSNDQLVAILNAIRYSTGDFDIVYLYALATKTEYRKMGIMSELINYISSKLSSSDVLCLVPANSDLFEFYKNEGFRIVSFSDKLIKTNTHVSTDYNTGFDYDIINKIYEDSLIGINHIMRTKDNWESITNDLYNDGGIIYYNRNSYAIYKNGRIEELMGSTDILDTIMDIYGLNEIEYKTVKNFSTLNGAIKCSQDIREVYINMVFE